MNNINNKADKTILLKNFWGPPNIFPKLGATVGLQA